MNCSLMGLLCVCVTGSCYVVQPGLDLAKWTRPASNSWQFFVSVSQVLGPQVCTTTSARRVRFLEDNLPMLLKEEEDKERLGFVALLLRIEHRTSSILDTLPLSYMPNPERLGFELI